MTYGNPHGERLYPHLGREVDTPDGRGVLLQVFTGRATVRLTMGRGRLWIGNPAHVRPADGGSLG